MTDNNAVVIPATVLVKGIDGLSKIVDKVDKVSSDVINDILDNFTDSVSKMSDKLKKDNQDLAQMSAQLKQKTEYKKYRHTANILTKQSNLVTKKADEKVRIDDNAYYHRMAITLERIAGMMKVVTAKHTNRMEEIHESKMMSSVVNTQKYIQNKQLEDQRHLNKQELENLRHTNKMSEMDKRAELSSLNKTAGFLGLPPIFAGLVEKLSEKALPVLSTSLKNIGEKLIFADMKHRGMFGYAKSKNPHASPLLSLGNMFKGLSGALSKVTVGAMAAGVGILVAGVTFVSKKILKVGKTIVSYFANIAKQAETVKALMELIALPFKIIFTLMAVPLLTAFIPVLEKMLQWISDNQDTIQAIGETLAKIFTEVFKPETMEIVTHLLNGFAVVLNFLATSIAENMKSVNTNSVASFIASTITAIAGVIQDVLMGLVAFCYSAEGQAFIVSLSESIGRIIGTLVVLLIEMVPVFLEILVVTVVGIIKGMWDVLVKQIASILDIIDSVTGGLFTNMANSIINVVNWFIDRINGVIGFLNNFGIGGSQMQHIDTWGYNGVGSNFGNAATSLTNSTSISSVFNITNNNNVSNSDTMKAIFMTGGM